MDILSGDISVLVLKRVDIDNIGEVSLDTNMLKVMMELDGKKTLSNVASILGINMKILRESIHKLLMLNLVECVEKAIPTMDKSFYDFLHAQLSKAMGPIAEVLIEDELQEMGEDPNKIPIHRTVELVDLLARQIPREEKRLEFQQALLKKIKEAKA
ncbi:MAG: hypothetical protein HQK76_15375 [Desulfobacterales bacterium]|nr:hypothetical protein [Desulfobacterales bacterium]